MNVSGNGFAWTVTAAGKDDWATDFGFNPTGGAIVLTLADGTEETYTSSAGSRARE